MKNRIPIVEKILGANEHIAELNRSQFDQENVLALNLMASPGAGKTSLIEQTVKNLASKFKIAVIDGDIATSIDADRAAQAGAIEPKQGQLPSRSTQAGNAISTQ